jgi:ribosome-binding factor A
MANKESSQRQQKVARLINESLINVLKSGKMLDLRLMNCPLTITKVLVTADLRIANCYFLPFNTDLSESEIMEALNNSKYVIRNYVTKEIKLRYSPEIRFHYDYSFDNLYKVEQIIKDTKTE